ncbi:hypothetical protein BT96DRAFT_912009 [Gymnopus androsaceus JB14]|uniref:Zn(2)-C6 fungal-type domain-containing protein n=1 Tax=Gymnopus androsaceus JB14 TaxID=1447944 RepID=A0A6A4IS61_9AGAR|nr:hypothetical protein BT96DRAFT_912009 [Gymnopus androsaceus JB14]
MSTEVSNKRKKAPSDKKAPQPAADDDHRKRRRNRTTQSCLNCHTSKRMCDRKRPACARCTQLGLTGLCVYEVDDPTQQTDSQDESSRLLKRVAELEGVIRELKNKPHPRWASSSAEQQSQKDDRYSSPNSHPSPPGSLSPSLRNISPCPSSSSRTSNVEGRQFLQTTGFSVSPSSSPSPATPSSEHSLPHIVINDGSTELTSMDLGSIFAHDTHFTGYEDNVGFGSLPTKPPYAMPPCNCLLDASNYQTMLELSLRIRRAAGVLGQAPHHRAGGYCPLNQALSDFDTLTTDTLSSVDSPHLCYNQTSALSPSLPTTLYGSGHSASRMNSWLSGAVTGDASNTINDSFMSWDPSRRS